MLKILALSFAISMSAPLAPSSATKRAPKSKNPISVQKLKPNERLTIEYTSQGCFHSVRTRYELRRVKGGAVELTVSTGPNRWRSKGPYKLKGRKVLSKSQVRQVDSLLAHHRARPGNQVCTTSQTMTLKVKRYGWLLRTEKIVDGSCRSLPKGSLTWRQLNALVP